MLDGPFRGSAALAAGLVSYRRLHGPRYRRVFPDVYLPAGRELDLATLSLAAYVLVRDRGGVLAGYSAAALLGADCAPHDAPAEVLMPHRMTPRPGLLRVYYGNPAEGDLTEVRGCRVTTPERTAWDLVRRLPTTDAVVALDALTHAHGFAPAALLARPPGARGRRSLPEIIALADPKAESPMETRLRLALVAAGLPVPEVQYEILDASWNLLARVDLAYPDARLAIEYDGAIHFDERQRARDIRRDTMLARHDWQTMRLDKKQVTVALGHTISAIRTALRFRLDAHRTDAQRRSTAQ